MLVGNSETMHGNVAAETTVVGYPVVIATVLPLSSEDMMLTGRQQPSLPATTALTQEERIDAWFDGASASLRASARSACCWRTAARSPGSPSASAYRRTLWAHVRHIYQKADVHDRQQFIDSVLSPDQTASPEPRDQAR